MVDKELKFLAKNRNYAFIKWQDFQGTIGRKLVYSNGKNLRYGDPAEIFPVAGGSEFKPFMESALSEAGYHREYYGFMFGYLAANFDDEEIKEDEVRIHYAGVDNTIKKKEFYELCLLLCDAKLNDWDLQIDKEVSRESLLQIKFQLEDKIKTL